MRGRPNPPKRYRHTRTVPVNSGDTLEEVLANFEEAGAKPSEARFQMRQTDGYDCNNRCGSYSEGCELIYPALEDEKIFERRLASYQKRLASWEEWVKNHKEEIATLLAERTEEKEAKLARLAERSRKALEREEKTLEKRLGNLKRRLQK